MHRGHSKQTLASVCFCVLALCPAWPLSNGLDHVVFKPLSPPSVSAYAAPSALNTPPFSAGRSHGSLSPRSNDTSFMKFPGISPSIHSFTQQIFLECFCAKHCSGHVGRPLPSWSLHSAGRGHTINNNVISKLHSMCEGTRQ